MMQVRVHAVHIGAMSTVGHGEGLNVEDGQEVSFVGDHRPMRHIGEAVEAAQSEDELPIVDLEDWQIR